MLKKQFGEIANPNIETLAEIMAERDETYKAYQKTGGHPLNDTSKMVYGWKRYKPLIWK